MDVEYRAYFDAGYYGENKECVLAFIIETGGNIVDVCIEKIQLFYNGGTDHLYAAIAETKALQKLLEYINVHYRYKKFKIFGDCRDLIKNVNYGSETENHRRIGDIVDTFKHLYNKDLMDIAWVHRSKNVLVDYLTRYYYSIEDNECSIIKITKDFKVYKEIEAKVLYELRFCKINNTYYQCFLLKSNENTYILSVRGSNSYTDYIVINELKELKNILERMSNDCKSVIFNNRKIGKDITLVKYINEKVILNYDTEGRC